LPRCWNRVRSIIEEPQSLKAGHSVTEIIRFFGYPRSTVYDVVTKCTALKTLQRRFYERYASEKESLEKTHREDSRSRWKDSSADFRWPSAIVAKISIDCWCKRANDASNCREESLIQIVHIKRYDRGSEAARTSCSPRLPFWSPNSLSDLNPLEYYVRRVVERVTNKSRQPNVTLLRTVIKVAFVGMDSVTLQRVNASDRE